ncbi:Myc-type [Theobroma cacao]|uniref:Transcription factor bHLH51 n=2 Tax=Theobroma cacao TaxID=3641 RepID=A0AB32UL32_THECC|nr:PREDICTED: transcription factor bHLH51 [Theobroma cacao]EOY17729.1 Basic helix-loop-helix DNA-binding superfamily protein, putative [Theobroma cacao]WRX11870.1 Myc-type [Theobroma cacao]
MENCYLSSWPEGENWAEFNATPSNESSFTVPLPIEPRFSASSSVQCQGFPSWVVPIEGVAEDRATVVSKSHSQAEKRRRDRINAQLAALRKLIPKSDKMDKAALLGSAIEHVKDLKRKATEVSKAFTIPTEVDEVTVDCDLPENISPPTNPRQTKDNKIFIRASVCCDDRPEVFAELIRVLKGLRLSTVKADISSVGGRMRSNLILCNDDSEDQGVSPSTLKQSLNVVLSRIASSSAGSNCRIRSKRQRLFLPSQFTQ